MQSSYPYIFLAAGIFIIISLIASRFATRFGMPALLATLAVGLVFGNGGVYDFNFNHPWVTLRVSEIALCIIIFTGGLGSNWKSFRPILGQGISLATLGVLVTIFVVGAMAHWLLGWPWLQALLLGAAVSATDAAAVFSILESGNLKLKKGMREVLEFESGSNDPMALFLTLSLTAMLLPGAPEFSLISFTGSFLWAMLVGLGTGFLAVKCIQIIVRFIPVKRGQLPVILLAWVLILYSVNTMLNGSALLAMYSAGIVLGNAPWARREMSGPFFESLAWMMETTLFLILGLQVYLQDLAGALGEGLFFSAVLILLARPVGVLASLAFFKKTGWREKMFYSWVGLRGATPIAFALIPVVSEVPGATNILNIVFIIVVVSVIIQGTTVARAARIAKVEES